jgi:hypothetical protein
VGAITTEGDFEEMRRMAVKLVGLRDDLRVAVGRVSDPRAKATLETGAEVLGGLRQAFVDYGEGAEEAWRR